MRQQTGSRNRGWLSAIGNRLSVAAGVALVAGMMAGLAPQAEAVSATATGGTVTEYPQGGKQWRALVFTNYPVIEIPKMTANNAPSGVASASSEQVANPAWKAMDQDGGTRWSSGAGMPQWLQYQFASGKVINGYEFSAFSASQNPSNFTLQASNDGSNWTIILDTQTSKSALSQQYVFSNTVSYTYYRLNVTTVGGGGATVVSLSEFKLYSMPALAVTVGGDVEYLVVAAGGAGGSSDDTGGGGAGGMLTGSVTLAAGTYPVSVGKESGKDSIFSTLRAIGGGAGANTSAGAGAAGGSGGGAVRGVGGNPYPGGAGTPGQGNRGGNGYSTGFYTGGGGGAGGPGVDANGVDYISAGGPGLTNSISGSPVPYAAGGKGYHRSANDPSGKGKAGDPNTGNGGNGGYNKSAGGAGGSGIVIIRYALPPKGTVIMMR